MSSPSGTPDSAPRRRLLAGLAAAPIAAAADAFAWPAAGQAPRAAWGVRLQEPVRIPVTEGLTLSGRLWLPQGRPGERFPVVFEYIPYRTRDSYRALDDRWGEALARRGVAFARVDIRGSGDSEGLLTDEYLASEQADGVAVIAWLARQPWCNGSVGMRGLSWGGFSTLQVAALAPPALKAIMPMCATDMRFWNDAHYVGGVPGLTNLKWAAGFELVMAAPPDPAVVGSRWSQIWKRRLAATPPIAARWLSHGQNDAYWRHGSVGLDYGAIKCPVYLVDGWADSYAESAWRLLDGLTVPTKALFGPWGHTYPDLAQPGPGLDWIVEEARWWRHWLAGEDTGLMQEPKVRFYMPYATPAETGMQPLPGRWAAETAWPPASVQATTLFLADAGLATAAPGPGAVTVDGAQLVGLANPEWIPYAPAELPRDQRPDDARSQVFDGAPLAEPLEILGVPELLLRVSSDRPSAVLAARLCEVTPDGASHLVSWGQLDLAFRDGPTASPSPLVPGESYEVTMRLPPKAHQFRQGSVVRLALSPGLWPMSWPSPELANVTIALGPSRLRLPVRAAPPAEVPMPIPPRNLGFSRGDPQLQIEEPGDGWVRVHGAWAAASREVAGVVTVLSGHGPDMDLAMRAGAPETCRWRVSQSSGFHRGDWDAEIEVSVEMTATRSAFHLVDRLVARQGGKPVFTRVRRQAVPRRAAHTIAKPSGS